MFTWFKRLLWDEAAFERYSRAVFGTAGLAVVAIGKVPETKREWLGLAFVFFALLTGAGDKNRGVSTSSDDVDAPAVGTRAADVQSRRQGLLGDRGPDVGG